MKGQFVLHEQFQDQALATPRGVALRESEHSITFADLNRRSEQIASALVALGIQRGNYVGLHIERSIDWVVAALAILKSNAAVAPLPPSYPEGRIRDILAFAALDLVIDDVGTPLNPSLAMRVTHMADLASGDVERQTPARADPDQPAFVLCSSGSTGRPKMIVRSHRSFFHRLQWTWDRHPYSADDVCCQKAHMTTTHAMYELFEPLLRGIPIVIISDQETRNLEGFWDTIRNSGTSRLLIVPSALRASLDMPQFEAPPLDVVVLMGEYVHPGLAERAIHVFPDKTALYSIYGSTEASSTLVCDLRESSRPGEELPLGKPISLDVQPLVLTADLVPAQPGGTGRLYICGTALFTEYYKDPELTASVLVDVPGCVGRAYDTSDEVQSLPDGNLLFLGRVDHTVKVRGFRVDLPEVERAILGHPGVSQAAVVLSGGDTANAMLLAFYTPLGVESARIYETLRDQLPDHMIPSVLRGIEQFPLTHSAKVDRVRLLEEHAGEAPIQSAGRPASHTERRVIEVWERALGHRHFGLENSFFEIGGTSLTVFSVVHQLREEFELDRSQLSEQSVYQFPRVQELAEYIDGLKSGRPTHEERRTPILVPLRKGTHSQQPPLFVVASAGGTLGAYEKLAKALTTTREIIGVRDPFIWGERDPTDGFQSWVARYIAAIRERQPDGPYYVCAYSSAGAFGYEVARRLRQDGQEVALLAMIDTLGISSRGRWEFGRWIGRAMSGRPVVLALARAIGYFRIPLVRLLNAIRSGPVQDQHTMSDDDVRQIAEEARHNEFRLLILSAQLELNTGLPFALLKSDFAGVAKDDKLNVLQARMESLIPEVDPSTVERIAIQYQLQARAQHAYELQAYDGRVLVVEAATPYAGLVALQLRPYVSELMARVVEVGKPADRIRIISARFLFWATHFRSMRDDLFVKGLASELDSFLDKNDRTESKAL